MSDYIKREDALELFEMLLDFYKDSGIQNIKTMVAIAPQEFHLSEDDEIADFNFELDGWKNDFTKIEPADVAPVRYGLWYADEDSRIVCSECKHGAPYMYKISDKLVMQELTDYCPNCGARMDGEDDEID